MPFPVALVAGLALTGVQMGMQSSAASRQNRYLRQLQIARNEQYLRNVQYQRDLMEFYTKRYQQNATAAMADADQQYSTIFDALSQRKRQANQTVARYARAAEGQAGRFRASQTETTGQSKRLALQDFERIEAAASNVVHENYVAQARQAERQLKGINAQAQARINQYMPQPMSPVAPPEMAQGVYQPGGLDMALALGNTFFSHYAAAASGAPDGADFQTIMRRMV